MKIKLRTLWFQWIIVFVPFLNFFYTFMSASFNMRKLKERSFFVVTMLIFFGTCALCVGYIMLLNTIPFASIVIENIFMYIGIYLLLFVMSFSCLIYHNAIMNKRIFSGEVVIENKKLYLLKYSKAKK